MAMGQAGSSDRGADLATGRLVRPFDHALKAVSSFYLAYPPEAIRRYISNCFFAGRARAIVVLGSADAPGGPRFPKGRKPMAHYVLLSNFTDQGIRTVKDTQKRAEAFKAMASKSGVKIHTLLWTLGKHDVVAVAEAEDDIAATALSLSIASMGNIRTETLRAFDSADMAKILAKMA
jgi:uncharacterized protein with GYD domain